MAIAPGGRYHFGPPEISEFVLGQHGLDAFARLEERGQAALLETLWLWGCRSTGRAPRRRGERTRGVPVADPASKMVKGAHMLGWVGHENGEGDR